MIVNCLHCNTEFVTEQRYINRGHGKYCSRSCSSSAITRKKPHIPNSTCAQCGIAFFRRLAHFTNSKSGLRFCSRNCKDTAQRLGGIIEIMPDHYGLGQGKHDYRARALNQHGNYCNRCGFNDLRAIEVHHIDGDRSNNLLSNLEVLCGNCHLIAHSGAS